LISFVTFFLERLLPWYRLQLSDFYYWLDNSTLSHRLAQPKTPRHHRYFFFSGKEMSPQQVLHVPSLDASFAANGN
jgi:hypothetical protein